MDEKHNRIGILAQVSNPLIFFSLALLIIEGIIGTVVALSNMSGNQQFYCVLIMTVLFLIVIGIVTYLTINWPEKLYRRMTEVSEFIDSRGFEDKVIDIIEKQMDSNALINKETKEVL